jgi:thiamine-phosphate pyrophosphorylase
MSTSSAPRGSAWSVAAVRDALRVVAITDDLRDGIDGLVARCILAERGGITMLQVRLKHATSRELLRLTRALVGSLSIPVIVNDRVDIALGAGAAGAHLGMQDLPITVARSLVPAGFLLGASLGSDAELLEIGDADYVGVGPVESTPSKLDAGAALGEAGALRLARLSARPCVAIGGVHAENAASLVQRGFDGVSVIRAVLSAPDPEAAARTLRAATDTGLAARDG